jgi:hypothetical protein
MTHKPAIDIHTRPIDWEALRIQKAWLLRQDGAQAAGLLHLIDHIQDRAVECGLPEQLVFGESYT